MRNLVTKHTIGFGVAGLIALGAATPLAATPLSNAAALNAAVPTHTDQIRWRGHRGGWWGPGAVVGGLAAGAIIGSQLAAPRYYGSYAYDSYPYSGYAYAPSPYYSYGYTAPYAYSGPYYRGGFGVYDRDCLGNYDSAGVRC